MLLGAGRKLHLDLIIQCHISMSQKMSEDDAFEIDTARKGRPKRSDLNLPGCQLAR